MIQDVKSHATTSRDQATISFDLGGSCSSTKECLQWLLAYSIGHTVTFALVEVRIPIEHPRIPPAHEIDDLKAREVQFYQVRDAAVPQRMEGQVRESPFASNWKANRFGRSEHSTER